MRVLVTDAANRVALAVVRALGNAGHEVIATEVPQRARPRPPVFDSRHVHRSIVTEDPRALAGDVDVAFPISINTILEMAGTPNAPIPDAATLRRANSRDLLLPLARELGIETPETWVPDGDAELKGAADQVSFPAVIKFRTDEGLYLEPGERYRVVRDRDELMLAYGRLSALQPRPMIQQFVPGEGCGWSAVYDRGRCVAHFGHRRLREYPPSGGPSTACESIHDATLAAAGRTLLDHLEWHGPAMVEFKHFGGRFVLMEINPRFWGSLPLAIDCGINFPALLVKVAMGEAPRPEPTYRAGRRIRFLFHDLAAALRQPRYWKGVLGDLTCRDGILSLDDPRASMRYLVNLVQ